MSKIITIYYDKDKKVRQIIRPMYEPKCSVLDIVQTITHSSADKFNYQRNYYSFDVENV